MTMQDSYLLSLQQGVKWIFIPKTERRRDWIETMENIYDFDRRHDCLGI